MGDTLGNQNAGDVLRAYSKYLALTWYPYRFYNEDARNGPKLYQGYRYVKGTRTAV